MRSVSNVLSLALLALLPALPAAARAAPSAHASEANMVLLEVRLGHHVLSDAVGAYQFSDDIYLPLGELARLLTLAVKTVPGEGRASGYVLTEQRTFSLDVLQREVVHRWPSRAARSLARQAAGR